jgi:hypothetical protein
MSFLSGRTSLTTVQTGDIAANAIDSTLTKDALIADYTEVTIAAGDSLLLGDVGDSGNTKRDTVQGLLDLVPAGGAWTLIESILCSNVANATLNTITSTYDTYCIIGSNLVPATDDVEPWFRIGDSSGIDATSNDYDWYNNGSDMSGGTEFFARNITAAELVLSEDGTELIGNQAGEGFGFTLYLHAPSDGTSFAQCTWHSVMTNSGSNTGYWVGGGARQAVLTVTQCQFLFESGNISTGRVSMWGISHA